MTGTKKQPVTKAPISIDKGVTKPRGIRQPDPDSALSQILKLEIGDCWTKSIKVPGTLTTWPYLTEQKRLMAQTMHSTVGRANKVAVGDNGPIFRLSTGDFRTQDGDVILCATVCREG